MNKNKANSFNGSIEEQETCPMCEISFEGGQFNFCPYCSYELNKTTTVGGLVVVHWNKRDGTSTFK